MQHNMQYWIIAILSIALVATAGILLMRKERFIETQFYGYAGEFGDRRSMKQQNFGIDDSIAGVFSARISTPKETYTKLFVRDVGNPFQEENLRLAANAKCKLACAK